MENIEEDIQKFYLTLKEKFKYSFNTLKTYLFYNELIRNELRKMDLNLPDIML